MLPAAESAPDHRWPQASPLSRWVERVVFISDSALPIPGTTFRVGLDPILGLLFPGGGDAIGGVISLSVLFLALQNRLPAWIVGKMVWNLALDAALGTVPLLGDAFDFGFRANQRNLDLLRAHAQAALPERMPARYWLSITLLLTAAVLCLCLPLVLSGYLLFRFLQGPA
jgi:hypothetical protein